MTNYGWKLKFKSASERHNHYVRLIKRVCWFSQENKAERSFLKVFHARQLVSSWRTYRELQTLKACIFNAVTAGDVLGASNSVRLVLNNLHLNSVFLPYPCCFSASNKIIGHLEKVFAVRVKLRPTNLTYISLYMLSNSLSRDFN